VSVRSARECQGLEMAAKRNYGAQFEKSPIMVDRVGHLLHVSLHWLLLVVRAREPTGCRCMQRSPPSVLGRPIVHSVVCVGAPERVDGSMSGRGRRG
jgi:hypothetical protein